jgi:hypothetical protein
MNQSTKFLILEKYPFELLPGEAVKMKDGDLSYYQYLNSRHLETGKNVKCTMWLLRNMPKGLKIVEPFGGVGVFSVALQEELKPSSHIITELDEQCVEQLKHSLKNYKTAKVIHGDAHELLGVEPADIYDCDFPFFTLSRFQDGNSWNKEFERMVSHNPKAIIVTDGSSCRYHWVYKPLQKRGFEVNENRESYAYAIGKYIHSLYGYSVTGCAYHANCFYLRFEKTKSQGGIEFKHFVPGTGESGLRKLK